MMILCSGLCGLSMQADLPKCTVYGIQQDSEKRCRIVPICDETAIVEWVRSGSYAPVLTRVCSFISTQKATEGADADETVKDFKRAIEIACSMVINPAKQHDDTVRIFGQSVAAKELYELLFLLYLQETAVICLGIHRGIVASDSLSQCTLRAVAFEKIMQHMESSVSMLMEQGACALEKVFESPALRKDAMQRVYANPCTEPGCENERQTLWALLWEEYTLRARVQFQLSVRKDDGTMIIPAPTCFAGEHCYC